MTGRCFRNSKGKRPLRRRVNLICFSFGRKRVETWIRINVLFTFTFYSSNLMNQNRYAHEHINRSLSSEPPLVKIACNM